MNNDDLFIACVNGNTKAKEILYKKYNNILFSICLKYFKHHDDSMDYLHDGFIHIFDKLLFKCMATCCHEKLLFRYY